MWQSPFFSCIIQSCGKILNRQIIITAVLICVFIDSTNFSLALVNVVLLQHMLRISLTLQHSGKLVQSG